MKNIQHFQTTAYIENVQLCSYPDCSFIQEIILEKNNEINSLISINEQLQKACVLLLNDNEHLRAKNNKLNHALFGSTSERVKIPPTPEEDSTETTDDCGININEKPTDHTPKKERGGQRGHKGHGRTIPELPEVEVVHEIPEDQMVCPICGLPLKVTGLTEDSHEVDYEVRIVLKKHRRKRAARVCNCPGKKFVTAPKEPQVIPKSKFSNNFWAYLLTAKYFLQIPLHRLNTMLLMNGLSASEGTLTGGFKLLLPILLPLYNLLTEVNRNEQHWHVDETGWKSFAPMEGKIGHKWWMWVFVSLKTAIFVLDPRRSSEVPFKHFGEDAEGIFNCDRFAAYSKLTKLILALIKALCWAHFRRDFINAAKSFPSLKSWSDEWVKIIGHIYKLNDERLAVQEDQLLFAGAQLKLECALEDMALKCIDELKNDDMHPLQIKILESAKRNWGELTTFVHYVHVPMDNNQAERIIRIVALGRKNYYGTHSLWGGELAAVCMSIFQTAAMHGLNGEAYLRYYFDECAKNGSPPANLETHLPWNIPEDVAKKYSMLLGKVT